MAETWSEKQLDDMLDAIQPRTMTPEERAAQFAEWDAAAEARERVAS